MFVIVPIATVSLPAIEPSFLVSQVPALPVSTGFRLLTEIVSVHGSALPTFRLSVPAVKVLFVALSVSLKVAKIPLPIKAPPGQ